MSIPGKVSASKRGAPNLVEQCTLQSRFLEPENSNVGYLDPLGKPSWAAGELRAALFLKFQGLVQNPGEP